MADSVFGDSLFDEFKREPQPGDKILRQKIKEDELKSEGIDIEKHLDSHGRLQPGGNDSNSVSSESESETDVVSKSEEERTESNEIESSVASMLSILRESSENHEGTNSEQNGESEVCDGRYFQTNQDLERIHHEKMRLEKISNLLSEKVKDEEGPAIQIVYMNHKVSRRYRAIIEEFVGGLIAKERKDVRQLPILQKRPNAANIAVKEPVATLPEEKIRQTKACTVVGCSQMYNEFALDYMGWPLVDYNTALTDGWQVPHYEQVYKTILPVDSDEEDEDSQKKPSRLRNSCFNCGGEHNLAECKLPKDFKRISKARAEFKSQNNTPQFSRYTMDSLTSKYEKLRPGLISKQLRDAIGISEAQLPPYIYQMRLFGYPPGWLKEAEVESSGISMFDKHGKEVSESRSESEDGEVEQTQKKLLNPNKLVSYPGFNVPIEKGTVDECEKLGMPTMQPNQHLDVLRAYLSHNYELSSGKRKHGAEDEDGPSSSAKKLRAESSMESDMEISLDQGASPLLVRSSNGSTGVSRPDTPSLSDLEAQQRALQRQLADEIGEAADINSPPPMPPTPDRPPLPNDTPPATPGTPNPGTPNPPLPPTPDRPPLPLGTPPVTPQTPKDGVFRTPHGITPISRAQSANESEVSSADEELPSGTSTPNRGDSSSIDESGVDTEGEPSTPSSIPLNKTSSLSASFGTPVLEGGTPSSEGKNLPSADKFADGITEHLPFENLPNSTGRYAEVRKLIDSAKKPRLKNS